MPLKLFFQCLDEVSVIQLLNHALFDERIVFLSENITLLNYCAEALRALLYPFSWVHVFISVLPSQLTDMLQAPVPFMLGIHSDLKHTIIPDPIEPVVIADLDSGRLSHAPKIEFPEIETKKLCKALKQLFKPEMFNTNLIYAKSAVLSDEEFTRKARELFATFFANIVGSMEEFLEKQKVYGEKNEEEEEIVLNEEKYIKSRPEPYRVCIHVF